MNIKRAKEEIKNTIQAYLLKNDFGEYEIPVMAQRPILLIGAPGIGKTQIMEQISRECGIGLVAYTITHHTRQSAIGLPFISRKTFDGVEKAVTEYTMSEIVASIYEKIEESGLREGILFIDEINCVSETLAPAMLQFLQCKTFGSHRIPEGWLIVAAGNPPEYNKSVREFDVVTMDRVKKIEVEPDFDAWKEYAYSAGVHPAVISYLNTRPKNFYRMESTVDGKTFATPRGWEDLSRLLAVYEKLDKMVDREVVVQYIQHPQIARDFANYLELFYKYRTDYQIDAVLSGHIDDILVKKAAHASFDERHLHFEVSKKYSSNTRINPEPYLNKPVYSDIKIKYCAYDNTKNKWLPEVNVGTSEFAGNLGNGISGFKLENETYRAHDKKKGYWLPWVNGYNGYAGNLPNDIDAIQIKNKIYRVYDNKKKKWLPWVNGTSGYAGNIGNSIGGIQVK